MRRVDRRSPEFRLAWLGLLFGLQSSLAVAVAVAGANPRPPWAPPACDPSFGSSAMSDGRSCCWRGQWWSPEAQACVGAPACPSGFVAVAERCLSSCADGQKMTDETAGHCCWPGQVWATGQARCVGTPVCPPGRGARGEDCVAGCPPGQLADEDTAGHCCWPDQAWSNRRNACVGIPACPRGLMALDDACAPLGAAPPSDREWTEAVPPLAAPARPTPPFVGPPAPSRVSPAQTSMSAAATVAITILSERPADSYLVDYGGSEPCATPCDVHVKPGKMHLRVFGDSRFTSTVSIEQPSTVRLYRRLQGYLAAGGFLIAAGVATGAGAASLFLTRPEPVVRDVASGLAVLGTAFVAVGTPLTVSAGRDGVRVVEKRNQHALADPPRLSGILIAPSATGAFASALLQF